MSDEVCKPLLTGNVGEPRAAVIDAAAPMCGCENCSLSQCGPLNLGEVLVRLVLSPVHVHLKKAQAKPAALSHAESMGMSTFRDKFISDEELLSQATKLVMSARQRDPKAGVFGVLVFKAALPKTAYPPEGAAAYCVYDVPDDGIDAHVDIYQRTHDVSPDVQVLRRQWLFGLLSPGFIAVDNFRGGLLSPLAPA